MNIRERLESLQSAIGKSKNRPVEYQPTPYEKLSELIKGEIQESSTGVSILKRTVYSLPSYSGQIRLHPENFSSIGFSRLIRKKDFVDKCDCQKMIFLDTETTGLAGGTGTFPFLIGLGYFQEETFCVDQYFLPDYSEEIELLIRINKFLRKYPIVVTYNGKTFDIPLINTRFKFNRIDPEFQFDWHIDLLHSARHFWKRRLDSCSLSQVELSILGTHRKEDIPGGLIPQIYFNYVSFGELGQLPLVFEHNKKDIHSLACLAGFMSQCAESPLNSTLSHGTDFFSLGRFYLIQEDLENSISCFQRSLEYPLDDTLRMESLKNLAYCYKRTGQWEGALKIWESMASEKSIDQYYVFVEMAKYYEHRTKNYKKARLLVEEFISHRKQNSSVYRAISSQSSEQMAEMQKRLTRLIEKEKRHPSIPTN